MAGVTRLDIAIESQILRKLYELHTNIVAKVTAVNLGKTIPTVDLQILWVGRSQENPALNYNYPPVLDVPLFTYGVGPDIKITVPVSVGTVGVVLFPEKPLFDFDGVSPAPVATNSGKLSHPLMGMMFIPTYRGGSVDPDNIVIKNKNSTITVSGSDIKIVAPSGLDCNGAKITADGDVVTAAGVSLNKVKQAFNPHTHGNSPGPSTSI